LVHEHRLRVREPPQDSPSAAIIADLALGEQQDQWLAVHIATRVQLGGLASFGPPDAEKNSLILRKLAAVRCGVFGGGLGSIMTVLVAARSVASVAKIRSNTPTRRQSTKRL
jgi:hypothetical protein